jgi:16S rRNA (adenine1518-N6/adenine1519-N6)-dimethyltransferase
MFLESNNQPQSMTLLVQKEVAQRIVARDGKESILSMSVKAYGKPKYVQKVPAMLFNPAPKVDSAVLHVADISKDFFSTHNITEKGFFKILKQGFAQKRKMLTNNLNIKSDTLSKLGIQETARAETLTLKQWGLLTQTLTSMI